MSSSSPSERGKGKIRLQQLLCSVLVYSLGLLYFPCYIIYCVLSDTHAGDFGTSDVPMKCF